MPAEASSHAAYRRLHADATSLLRRWPAPTTAQDILRHDLLGHLSAHPDAMARSGPPAHLAASALVFDADLRRVLLTHHRKAHAWLQLGGHCEPTDASVWAAAVREVQEESGIAGVRVCREIAALARHRLVGDFGRCREHLDVQFAAVAPRGAEPVTGPESIAVRWWPLGRLPRGSAARLGALVPAGLQVLARCRSEGEQRHDAHREGRADLADADLRRAQGVARHDRSAHRQDRQDRAEPR